MVPLTIHWAESTSFYKSMSITYLMKKYTGVFMITIKKKKTIWRWSFTLGKKRNPTSHFYFQLKRAQEYCSKEKKNQTINPVTWKHQEDWGHTECWEGVEFEEVSVTWEGSKSKHYIGRGTSRLLLGRHQSACFSFAHPIPLTWGLGLY